MPESRILTTAHELLTRLDDPNWAIVDCRFDLGDPEAGQRAYEAAHIPGAVFLDLDKDLAGPYDAGPGAVAARAWWTFRWLGHDAVYLLDGGLGNWESLGFPLASSSERPGAAEFRPRRRDEWVLGTDELAANAASIAQYQLLDARDPARFRGEVEPIDSVAGHIPGAINLPFANFVREDGTWLPLEERTALLEQAIGSDRAVKWSVMCGSGVTACHLAITGLEAGFREPRLYVGSWSEWIRDPGRPITTTNT
jgi:thiosulfate/3-mercaptopyruvate sulfurtransferase